VYQNVLFYICEDTRRAPAKKRDRLCEGRLSSTVLCERGGETPLRDPTSCHKLNYKHTIMIDEKGYQFALSEIKDGFIFEKYIHCFLGSTLSYSFIPIGGSKDGGVDGLNYVYSLKGKENQIFQISTESDIPGKIDDTMSKLIKNGKSVDSLTYITNRVFNNIEETSDSFFDKYKVPLRIFDLRWLSSHSNDNASAIQCYYTFIDTYLHKWQKPSQEVVVADLDRDPRVYIYLRQQLDRSETSVKLDEILADGLIMFALEDTNPDEGKFKSKEEIFSLLEKYVKFSSKTLENLIEDRLEYLITKPRSVRFHIKQNGYCLPFETRTLIQERNLIDGGLANTFTLQTEALVKKNLDAEGVSVKDVATLLQETIHKLYYKQGLEFSNFILTGDNKDVVEENLHSTVAQIVDESKVVEKNRTAVKNAIIYSIREIVYRGTNEQVEYLKCLSNTYLTMFMLQWDPKLATYFQAMASDMNIFVDNSIIIPALSEFYLDDKNKRHWNLLKGAKLAGINLLINETIMSELVAHFRMLQGMYFNLFEPMLDVYNSPDEILFVNEIMMRAFLYAKMQGKVNEYSDYIENFLDPDLKTAKEDLVLFLKEEFGIEYKSNEDLGIKIDQDKFKKVSEHLMHQKEGKSANKKAENDAHMMLTIYKMREVFNEQTTTGIFGYKTWWLSKDTSTYRSVIQVLGEDNYPISCYMRPDFIYNYIALAPNKTEVDEVYKTLFPSLLGVNISYHIPSELADTIQQRMIEFVDKPPHVIKRILRRLSDNLKSDPRIRNRETINLFLDDELRKFNEGEVS